MLSKSVFSLFLLNCVPLKPHSAPPSCTNSSDRLGCLRSADVSILTEANNEIGAANFYGTYTWVPVVDGTFIVERPSVLLQKGQLNGVRLIARSIAFIH